MLTGCRGRSTSAPGLDGSQRADVKNKVLGKIDATALQWRSRQQEIDREKSLTPDRGSGRWKGRDAFAHPPSGFGSVRTIRSPTRSVFVR
jgi:hypothetical protein